MMGCKVCGEGGGPLCYTCRQIMGGMGGPVESALLAAENGRRRAEQQLEAERVSHAATAARERKAIADLHELREEYAALTAELADLRSALGQVAIGRAASARLLPAAPSPLAEVTADLRPPRISTPGAPPGLHADQAAPPPVGGNADRTPSTQGSRAAAEPTTPAGEPADPASARYSLLELD